MHSQHGGSRRKVRPSDERGGARPGAGRPKQFEPLRLAVADADLLRSVIDDLDLLDALRRIAAAAAADPDGTKAALAPLLAVDAWNEEIL